jgi:predicted esterase
MPWNYNNPENINKDYPLVIFLHGLGGAGYVYFLNYIGYDNPEDDTVDSVAYRFQKDHPCFTLVPQTDGEWNNTSLIEQVEKFKTNYRIDESRIYLIGYSMGGSGSWSFANAYNQYNGHLFAGLIRLAGQSQTQVTDDIAENTAMWLHIGLDDVPLRVDVTREAYNFLRDYHNSPGEKTEVVPIEGYTGKTYSLMLNGEDFIKRTEYENIGHGISAFPFKDPYLIEWLFRHSLNPSYNESIQETICDGMTYLFGTQTLTEAGEYTEVFKSVTGSDSIVTLTIVVDQVEKPTITQRGDTLICNNEGEYVWYYNGLLIEGAKDKIYIAQSSGNYQTMITNINRCKSNLSDALEVIITSVKDLTFAKNIKVYPNPTFDKITIEGMKGSNKTNIQLFDSTGRNLYSNQPKSTELELDITEFAPGIYNLVISNESNKVDYKILKK